MAVVPEKKDAGQESPSISPKAIQLLQELGLVFSHSALYGLQHSVTIAAMTRCSKILSEVLAEKEDINISVTEDELLVNGIPVESALPTVQSFVERLSALSIASFSLTRGITEGELANVIELLQATPDEMRNAGGFAAVIGTLGLTHVRSKRVTIKQVTEDEMVVSKEKLSRVVGPADMESVVKFLKGEADSASPAIRGTIQACAADVRQVSELVIQAAGLTGSAGAAGGAGAADGLAATVGTASAVEGADKVVEAVRRLYDSMAGGPEGQSQKGKKGLIKFLEELEGSLLEKMRNEQGMGLPEAEARISNALEAMKDELRIDSLAVEYAKKRTAISASERRILRYIETVGWAVAQKMGLKDRLAAEGLTPEEWEDLVDKSGLGGAVETSLDAASLEAERVAVASDLAKSLSLLGRVGADIPPVVSGSETAPVELELVLAQVGDAVTKLVNQTERKIESFASKVRKSEEAKGSVGVSRKAIIEFLAEIVQELRQPLSVIMTAVDVLKDGMLGAISQKQMAMLGMVATSANRLDLLVTKLADVSGMPEGLSPDAKILDSVYGNNRKNDPT